MIVRLGVEGFRGVRRLEIAGLGRVNVFTGKNDSGKTAVLDALRTATAPSPLNALAVAQRMRQERSPVEHFDPHWRTIFCDGRAEAGFAAEIGDDAEGSKRVRVSLEKPGPDGADGAASPHATWELRCAVTTGDGTRVTRAAGGPSGVEFPDAADDDTGGAWIGCGTHVNEHTVRRFSNVKQRHDPRVVVALLRSLDPAIEDIEILAPTGTTASLFVRFSDGTPLLPLSAVGKGIQRCFDLAAGIAAGSRRVFIDDVENGIHHSAYEPLWTWIAETTATRGVQVLASSHSEECVLAAARAFTAASDDGLRVIRLDRSKRDTSALVYDRRLVASAGDVGIDLRG